MKVNIQKLLPYFGAIAIMLLVNVVYFLPQFQGKVPEMGDIVQYRGMSKEAADYLDKTGEETLWTNSMFGGMPTYQISASNPSNLLKHVQYGLFLGLDRPAGYFFFGMLSMFILMSVFGANVWISMLSALLFGLCTNHFILFEAGHSSKIMTIFTAPLLIAGLVLLNKKSYLYGAALFTLGAGLNLYANHPQMTYYLAMALVFYVGVEIILAAKKSEWAHIGKLMVIYLLGSALALGASWSKISATIDYTKDTMRGTPILTTKGDGGEAKKGEGLEYDYAMAWSNNSIDILSSFVPYAAGGSSGQWVEKNSKLARQLNQNKAFQAPTYWGGLPFTSGPAYLGILAIFLAVLGFFTIRHWIKWWLLGAVLLTFILSMGKNFAVINDLFFNYLPYFNRFRTPNSVLSVTTLFIPIMAGLGLHGLMAMTKEERASQLRSLYMATGIVAGGCALLAILGPSMFSFAHETSDANYAQIIEALTDYRKTMLSSSAWKSCLIVLGAAGVLWLYIKNTITSTVGVALLAVLGLIDLFPVDKTYFSDRNFVSERVYDRGFEPRSADLEILKDKDLSYRVYDASINTFNAASTSYFHKTVGGYSAVKLQRFQDLIDKQIGKGNQRVLDMLNTRYYIVPANGGQGEPGVQRNPNAYGNAWLVDSLIWVNTPDEEIAALDSVTNKVAIVHKEFSEYAKGLQPDGQGQIALTAYQPNKLTYEANVASDQLAVFSEIWYGPDKGWHVTIDGQPSDHIRVNYLLRGLKIPAGKHTIEFSFKPEKYYRGEKISLASSVLILLLVIGAIGMGVKEGMKE